MEVQGWRRLDCYTRFVAPELDFIPLLAPEVVPARVGGIGGEVIIRIRRALCKPLRQLREHPPLLRQHQLTTYDEESPHLGVQQIIPHDVPRASRVLGKGGVSRRLKLHQPRVLVSKELGDILRVCKWSYRVELSRGAVHQQSPGSRKETSTDRVSDDQDTVAQGLAFESRQGLDGTNGPLGDRRPTETIHSTTRGTEERLATHTPDHMVPTGVHSQSRGQK